MPSNKHLRLILKIIYIAVGIIAIVLFFRYLLGWLLPFLIAFVLAAAIEPAVKYLNERTRIPRSLASAIMTVLILVIFFGILTAIVLRAIFEIDRLLDKLPQLLTSLPSTYSELEIKIYKYILSLPTSSQEFATNVVKNLLERSAEIPSALYSKLLNIVSSAAASTPKVILFSVTTALATFFTSSSYRKVKDFILRQIPVKWHKQVLFTKGQLKLTIWQWIKAQLLILLITFFELMIAFLMLRVDYSLLLAVIIAIIDALPVFGTGIVLLPWAIIDLVSGNTTRGIALIVLYVLTYLVRRIVEPKLIGDKLGLHPLATLLAMYLGYCTLGVGGMIFMPLVLILLKQLQDTEYISLWK